MATYSSKKYPSGSITSAQLEDGSVVAVDIANSTITSAKLASDITITNLTGTNDAAISGLTVGKGGGADVSNTVVGSGVLTNSGNTGGLLQAFGYVALASNTTGVHNDAFGAFALNGNTTGSFNSGLGTAALSGNTTGSYNVAVGKSALQSNTTASNNTAVGYQAGYTGTTATQNAYFGAYAGYSTTTSSQNAFIGMYAGYGTTTGDTNTALGYGAYYTATTGTANTALGQSALYYTTTGSNNVAVGKQALNNNTTASNNTAVGYQAGYSNTIGPGNTIFGYQAGLSNNNSVGYNTLLGYGAGSALTNATQHTIIGAYNGNTGNLDIRTASNYIVLSDGAGNPRLYTNNTNTVIANALSGQRYSGYQINTNGTYNSQIYWDRDAAGGAGALFVINASGGVYLTNTGTSWTSNSDERLKENLVPIENGLEKVCSLRSVIGNFITDENKKPTPFLIAQDVQTVLPEAVTSSTIKGDDTEYLGVQYTEVIPLLVAAIKELKAEVDSLKQQLGK